MEGTELHPQGQPESSTTSANDAPYARPVEDVLNGLGVARHRGLTPQQVTSRSAQTAANLLPEPEPRSIWQRLWQQFNQFVVGILFVAAIISAATGDWIDSLAVLVIVLLNGILGFVQEEQAERSLQSLKKMTIATARVVRDGATLYLPTAELVVGDVVQIEAGDSVPADARLIESTALIVQEAALTGESTPVSKDARRVLSGTIPLADQANMVFLGTKVMAGKATAAVTSTGLQTQLGRIAGLLGSDQRELTPLQKRLEKLGRLLAIACLLIVAFISGVLLWRGHPLSEILLPAVSLAVAAVPEGLPAVVTIALALGLQRLVRRNALVRRLASVETLGSVTVICTDKTGTLTKNEMTVVEIIVGDTRYQIAGTGYTPQGEFRHDDAAGTVVGNDPDLDLALIVGARCNNARVVLNDSGERWQVIGDPTEGALIVAAMKRELLKDDSRDVVELEIPFDSTRKMMSVVMRRNDGRRILYVKGAPEIVLERCRYRQLGGGAQELDVSTRTNILSHNTQLAARALRVLALAYHDSPAFVDNDVVENELTFLGLVGMIDPAREEARTAVALCRTAGIIPVMITGDHPSTARAIAGELGILDVKMPDVLTGADVDTLNDVDLQQRVSQTAVYARVTAEHKLRIVQAWKTRHEIVAMTGDGVNDAPAIQAADIGVAMGLTGTDVTKEASDMVLLDDNFSSIVGAIEEGRGIRDNIQKVIHYLLACNTGEVLLVLLAAVLGVPVPLTALQILWMNLVTDGFPALALAVEPAEPNLMQRKPQAPESSLISSFVARSILAHGALIAAASFAAFYIAQQNLSLSLESARLVTFSVAAFAQLFFALGCRSERLLWPELGWFTNPSLFLAVAASALTQVVIIAVFLPEDARSNSSFTVGYLLLFVGLSLVPVTAIEIGKLFRRWRGTSVVK